eukprot:1161967-Pelagomonas_calceolata.AAC.2
MESKERLCRSNEASSEEEDFKQCTCNSTCTLLCSDAQKPGGRHFSGKKSASFPIQELSATPDIVMASLACHHLHSSPQVSVASQPIEPWIRDRKYWQAVTSEPLLHVFACKSMNGTALLTFKAFWACSNAKMS